MAVAIVWLAGFFVNREMGQHYARSVEFSVQNPGEVALVFLMDCPGLLWMDQPGIRAVAINALEVGP